MHLVHKYQFLFSLWYLHHVLQILCFSTGLPKVEEDLDNQFILGGLFPVHAVGKNESQPCGVLLKDRGIQRLEAMRHAMKLINEDRENWNITLGAVIMDTCSSDIYAVRQSLDFVKTQDCEDPLRATRKKRISAIVGAASSPVSESVASVMRLFSVPQVSYASTSQDLDDIERFPYFMRVVPSDKYQVQVILDFLEHMKWNYVAAIASDGGYGVKAIHYLEELMKNSTVDTCIATKQFLPRSPTHENYFDIINKLLSFSRARAVVVFLNEVELRGLLNATDYVEKARSHFLWVGSDSWGTKMEPISNMESLTEGAVTVLSKPFPFGDRFKDYFQSLNPSNNEANPWFREYWEKQHKCVFNALRSWQNAGSFRLKLCKGSEKLRDFKKEGLISTVMTSVYVIASALQTMCMERPDVCADWDQKPNGQLLRQYILNVTRKGNDTVMSLHFDDERSIPVNYTVYQFRKVNQRGLPYAYIPIGQWNQESRLVMTENPTYRRHITPHNETLPTSMCSAPCKPGYERIRYRKEGCCWKCQPCEGNNYLPDPEKPCTLCPDEHAPNEKRDDCVWLRPLYMGSDWTSLWMLLPVLFSFIGIACTILTAAIFFWYRDTPIIMASGKELCCTMLAGIFLCYSFTFIAISQPTKHTCRLMRITLGFGLAVCYASIFTKTNRISRIFNRRLSTTKRPAYISPQSQVAIVACLVSIQLTLSVMWLIVKPAKVDTEILTEPRGRLLTCGIDGEAILVSLVYNMLLVFMCTVYAFKTRNIPENFNEAKFISFTMYSSCICWLAFIAIFSSTWDSPRMKNAVLCTSLSLSGTAVLLCLFSPKVYLVIFKPHKNVRYPTSTTHSASGMDTTTPVRFMKSGVNISNHKLTPHSSENFRGT